jgi:hypothetical protein
MGWHDGKKKMTEEISSHLYPHYFSAIIRNYKAIILSDKPLPSLFRAFRVMAGAAIILTVSWRTQVLVQYITLNIRFPFTAF